MENVRLDQRSSRHLKLLNCPHCNAPIDYSLGETLFTCKYCGYTFSMIREGEYKEIAPGTHFMLVNNYNETEMQEVTRDWMRKGIFKAGDLAEKSEITKMELKFVPIWIVNVSADTTYHGKEKIVEVEKRTRPSSKSGEPPIEEEIKKVRWVDKSGDFSDVIDWKILATKGMSLPLDKIELSVAGKIPFNIENVSQGAKLINGDVDEKLAKEKSESGIRNYHRDMASKEVDQLLSINTNVQVGEAQLLTIPFWFIRYKYKNKLYPIVSNGSSGKVVEGKAPMGKYDILMIAGIIIAIIVVVILAIALWPK
jgi:rubredoxin